MSSIRERFEAEMPGHFFLSDKVDQVEAYLIAQGVMPRKRLMKKGATIDRIEPLLLGKMDVAMRVYFGEGLQPHGQSIILKQARPWVEQQPSFTAPVSRSRAEAGYLKMLSRVPALAAVSPKLIHHDAANHVLVLHDFGESSDLTDFYGKGFLSREVNGGKDLLTELVGYLNTLHAHFLLNPPVRPVVNKGMRKFKHEEMFVVPFQENSGQGDGSGISSAFAKTLSEASRKRVVELGERYLDFKTGGTLLHGDFSFGNVRLANDERKSLYVLGAESCISGPPEFDFGVFVAQLHLSCNEDAVERFRELYTVSLDERLWKGYAGVELMRNLLGVAELSIGDVDRESLLETARSLIQE